MIQQIIPDIHGRSIDTMKVEKVRSILLGDYWDSFDLSFEQQLKSFYEWMQFVENTDSICLIGNHDEHYINLEPSNRGSGFQDKHYLNIHHIMLSYKDKFKYAHYDAEDKVVYTHAGITEEYVLKLEEKYGWIQTIEELVEIINSNPSINSYIGYANGGSDSFDGILWLRPSTYTCPSILQDVKQIVGHTYRYNDIRQYGNMFITDIGRAIFKEEINNQFYKSY